MSKFQLLEDYEKSRISEEYYEINQRTVWFWKTHNECTFQWGNYTKTLKSGSLHTFNVKYPITLRIGREQATAPVETFYHMLKTPEEPEFQRFMFERYKNPLLFKRVLYAYLKGRKDRDVNFSRPQWDRDKVLILYILNVVKAIQHDTVQEVLGKIYGYDLQVISFSKKDGFYSVKPKEWFTYNVIPKAGYGMNVLGKILKDISKHINNLNITLEEITNRYHDQLSKYKIFDIPLLDILSVSKTSCFSGER